jgi:hypothetical protein
MISRRENFREFILIPGLYCGSVRTDLYRSATGHFTQLVWRNTTTVGCARTECNGGQKGGNGDAPGWYVHIYELT